MIIIIISIIIIVLSLFSLLLLLLLEIQKCHLPRELLIPLFYLLCTAGMLCGIFLVP